MVNLYFNCKITSKKISYNPNNTLSSNITKFKILKKTIESLRVLKFKNSIFNVDLDDENNLIQKKHLKLIIKKNIKSKKIILNFSRPSTVDEWIKDIKIYENFINKNEPVVVVMNHDHPYVDYSTKSFYNCIKKIFPKKTNNYQKVFFYSHGPEMMSSINNNHEFKKYKFGLYKINKINKFIDSICVMSFETLRHIWNSKVFKGDYIGRFDWPDTGFTSKLNLIGFVYPREFFKHFDGYSHVTSLKNISKMNIKSNLPNKFPKEKNYKNLIKFYYQKWLDVHLISVRDSLLKKIDKQENINEYFLKELKNSMFLMDKGYFSNDLHEKLISMSQYTILKRKLYEHIKSNSDYLIKRIITDIKVSKKKLSVKNRLLTLIFSYFPSWITFEIKRYKKKFLGFY